MNYLFTSESVSEGHPDKVADQISDAILDEFLRQDPESKVACETFCTAGLVVVGGEVLSDNAYVDIQETARKVIGRIGYTKAEYGFDAKSCGIISTIHEQSADINRGVKRATEMEQGAGDQGMMFGYACRDTEDYMPFALYLSHRLLQTLADIRHNEPGLMPYLRPDAKSQFTVEFSAKHKPLRVHTIVLSTQHDEFAGDEEMHDRIEKDVRNIVIPRLIASLPAETAALFDDNFELFVNPTGKFVIGGPAGDTGLTGRKIIVDTYGGRGAHGGGAFSGKDPSKVDRSAAYAARHIAKNLVAAGVADECLVQLAYAIGVAEPVSIFVDTYGSAHVNAPASSISDEKGEATDAYIASRIKEIWDLRPAAIVSRFGLKNPIYEPTAAYGHMGRKPYVAPVKLRAADGSWTTKDVQFFGWEKLDAVEDVKRVFGIGLYANPHYRRAQEFIAENDLAGLGAGTHVIDEGNLWVNIVDASLRPAEKALLEAHNEFIDIQIPLSCPETYGVKPRSECVLPKGEFDAVKDIIFFDDAIPATVSARPGEQIVFEPDTAHAPLIGEGPIHKAIFKVRVK